MKFPQNLQEGRFQKRYKRFFVDIEKNGDILTAHCPNTGSMMGLNTPGTPCLFSTSDDPHRKLKQTLQMIKAPKSWVGVNTGLPNKLVMELFDNHKLPHWKNFDHQQAEVKVSVESRIDLIFWSSQEHPNVTKWRWQDLKPPLHMVEVKNVTLAENGVALFPDAVTTRGAKHLEELIHLKKQGYSCEMVFVVQRSDCSTFAPADTIDPHYSKKLRDAQDAGVILTALPCRLSAQEIELLPSPLKLNL